MNIPINYAHIETEIGFTIIRMASSHFDIQNIKSQGDKVVFSICVRSFRITAILILKYAHIQTKSIFHIDMIL